MNELSEQACLQMINIVHSWKPSRNSLKMNSVVGHQVRRKQAQYLILRLSCTKCQFLPEMQEERARRELLGQFRFSLFSL